MSQEQGWAKKDFDKFQKKYKETIKKLKEDAEKSECKFHCFIKNRRGYCRNL